VISSTTASNCLDGSLPIRQSGGVERRGKQW
jgi:hypothetical protein